MRLLKTLSIIVLTLLSLHTICGAHEGGKVTILLMRHAEKELKGSDPELNKAGKKRAAALPETLKEWKPDAFYSTATKRTQQTVTPWAKALGRNIETYEAATQSELANQLKHMGGKTIVVVGHSNTIPQLANMLLGSSTYTDLPDSEYNKLWIIRIDHGHATVELREMGD